MCTGFRSHGLIYIYTLYTLYTLYYYIKLKKKILDVGGWVGGWLVGDVSLWQVEHRLDEFCRHDN